MNNLKAARKAKRMTQTEVARYIGLAQSSYSAWENGTTKIDHASLLKLSDLFDVSIDYLLGNESEKPTAGSDELTKDEETVIQLLRQVPEEQRELVLNMIEAALKTQGLLD